MFFSQDIYFRFWFVEKFSIFHIKKPAPLSTMRNKNVSIFFSTDIFGAEHLSKLIN